MPVLMTSDMPGVTDEGYAHLAAALLATLKASEGFISHAAGPAGNGYRVTQLWQSQAAHDAWYCAHVLPAMPPGAPAPTITYQSISNIVAA